VVGLADGAPRLEVVGKEIRVHDSRGLVGTADAGANSHLRKLLDTVRQQSGLRPRGTDPRMIVLRFADGIEFRRVRRVINAAASSGYTLPLFQARKNGKWVSAAVPQVPSVAPNPALLMNGDPQPLLEVAADAVQVAEQVHGARQRIADRDDRPDLDALVKWLASRGATPELRHRRDLLVSATPEVPYGRIMTVVDAARTAGFGDVRLVDPRR
jgi:biopolymer transport protein ExbD